MTTRFTRSAAAAMLALSLSSLAATAADARRGGSFGSRGSRTYIAPRQTYNSPRYVPPVERSMTSPSQAPASARSNPGYAQNQPYRPTGSRFGGFGGGLIGGLIAGGLIGHFFGGGWNAGWGGGGSGGGMLAALLQILLLGGIVWLVIGFFRRRQQPATSPSSSAFTSAGGEPSYATSDRWGGTAQPAYQPDTGTDIAITPDDQRAFERLLSEVQDAFGREDYARLRQLTTPEIMSYLSEELSHNATQGVRNEVRGTRLLDAEITEAWREGSTDYATIALRYESIDVMRDRTTGALVRGSAEQPTETLEYWTFVRTSDGAWRLSAIQEG